jgi:Na+/melibiose symporter-like transporter
VREFLMGMLGATTLTVGLFFMRYWRASRDRLFVYFSLAFAVMSLSWIALAIASVTFEGRHLIYLLRLLAFVLIIIGIVDKNRRVGRL